MYMNYYVYIAKADYIVDFCCDLHIAMIRTLPPNLWFFKTIDFCLSDLGDALHSPSVALHSLYDTFRPQSP